MISYLGDLFRHIIQLQRFTLKRRHQLEENDGFSMFILFGKKSMELFKYRIINILFGVIHLSILISAMV